MICQFWFGVAISVLAFIDLVPVEAQPLLMIPLIATQVEPRREQAYEFDFIQQKDKEDYFNHYPEE